MLDTESDDRIRNGIKFYSEDKSVVIRGTRIITLGAMQHYEIQSNQIRYHTMQLNDRQLREILQIYNTPEVLENVRT